MIILYEGRQQPGQTPAPRPAANAQQQGGDGAAGSSV